MIGFDDAWRARAACVGHQHVMFASGAFEHAVAVQLCAGCPSRQPCAQYALGLVEHGQHVVGTWAGVALDGPDGRRALRAQVER
jgi:hypothetical protein